VSRTREAGSRDEVEGVVAITLNSFRGGAVGFSYWLGVNPRLAANALFLSKIRQCSNDRSPFKR